MNPIFRAGIVGASFPILLISPFVLADALEEVVVTAARVSQTVDETLAATTLITRKEIETSQANTLIDLLRKYSPGVDFTVRGGLGKSSGLHLRGTETDHVLVLIDGIRAGSVTTGAMAWSVLSADMIERIEIVRGPRSSLYGSDAIGGIVSITTRKGESGSWHGSLSAGSFNTKEVTLGTSLGNEKTQFSVNVSSIDTDGFDAKVSNNPDKDGYDKKSINMHLKHKLSTKTQFALSALYADGTNEYDSFGDDNKSYYNTFVQQNLGLKVKSALTTNWNSSLTLGEYRDESEAFDGFPGFFNTTRQQINWQNDLSFGADALLSLGIDHQRDEIDSTTAYAEKNRNNTGLFVEYLSNVGSHDFQISLRTDDNEAFGTHTTGGLAVGRDFGQQNRLIASYGTAFKAPTFNELYFPNFGNADLKPEKSNTFEIGLRTKVGGGQFNANLFRTHVSHLISSVLIDPANFTYQAQNTDKAQIDGLELDFTRDINRLTLNTNLTLLNPEDRATGKTLESRVKQTFKLNIDRDLGKVSLGGTLLAQGERAKGTFSKVVSGYTTADLRASYKISKHLQLKAEMNNVLDKEYQTKDGYNMPDRNIMFTISYQ